MMGARRPRVVLSRVVHGLRHGESDSAHGVGEGLEPTPVDHCEVVDTDTGQLLDRLDIERGAAKGVCGVDLVSAVSRDRDPRVPRNRDDIGLRAVIGQMHQHDRVCALCAWHELVRLNTLAGGRYVGAAIGAGQQEGQAAVPWLSSCWSTWSLLLWDGREDVMNAMDLPGEAVEPPKRATGRDEQQCQQSYGSDQQTPAQPMRSIGGRRLARLGPRLFAVASACARLIRLILVRSEERRVGYECGCRVTACL